VQLAFVLSGSRCGAEDIAQDALVTAWKRWRGAVRALPTRQRQMLALYYLGDCSVGEIALTLCVPRDGASHSA
jgi:DNA-directed RNA polymerase specialized sigma24 family protein